MKMIKKNLQFSVIFLFLFLQLFSLHSEERGRREYFFDLYKYRKQISVTPNSDFRYECTLVLPTMKIGYPQKNDIINVYWKGVLKTPVETQMKAFITFKGDYIKSDEININTENFEGGISFITPQNIINPISITFYYPIKENHGNQITFNPCYSGPSFIEDEMEYPAEIPVFESEEAVQEAKIIITTDKGSEVATDLKLERQKIQDEINRKLEEERLAEEQLREKERIENEKKAEAERLLKLKLEEERLLKEAEDKKNAALAAEEALKSTEIKRYKKENLLDYQKKETPSISNETQKKETVTDPDETDFSGQTLLMKAAKAGNDWQIKRLIEAGAKVNLRDKDGWTALMYAARYQENKSTIELLINAGSDITIKNNYNYSALSLAAAYNDNPDITKKLLQYFKPTEKEVLKAFVLMLSNTSQSEFVQLAKFQVFIDKPVPINAYYDGKTPLMYAAQFGNSTKLLKTLLNNGALTAPRSSEGKTAFDYASENKRLNHDDFYWELNKQ